MENYWKRIVFLFFAAAFTLVAFSNPTHATTGWECKKVEFTFDNVRHETRDEFCALDKDAQKLRDANTGWTLYVRQEENGKRPARLADSQGKTLAEGYVRDFVFLISSVRL